MVAVNVPMVEVLAVLVPMGDGVVLVRMAVGADRHRIVAVFVVAVVVPMHVLVPNGQMLVKVLMPLRDVQRDARGDQETGNGKCDARP